MRWLNISIHALREEGDVVKASQCADPPDISIHALREEGDQCGLPAPGSAVDFNPRPPRGGRRYLCWQSEIVTNDFNPRPPRGGRRLRHQITVPGLVFQSTPSARRATRRDRPHGVLCEYFNPRPPRGGRHNTEAVKLLLKEFQSTPSARRATGFEVACGLVGFISIHALREEGDHSKITLAVSWIYFNPRPPRGGRPGRR